MRYPSMQGTGQAQQLDEAETKCVKVDVLAAQGARLLTRLYAATGMARRPQHGSAHSARAGPSSAATCACSACSRRPCASASSYLAACPKDVAARLRVYADTRLQCWIHNWQSPAASGISRSQLAAARAWEGPGAPAVSACSAAFGHLPAHPGSWWPGQKSSADAWTSPETQLLQIGLGFKRRPTFALAPGRSASGKQQQVLSAMAH